MTTEQTTAQPKTRPSEVRADALLDSAACDNCKHGPQLDTTVLMDFEDERGYTHPCQFCMRAQPYEDHWVSNASSHAAAPADRVDSEVGGDR